ncbi:MAG TPA: efflux transporter outer membrane subunit [Candidatus Acidoferrum sp.]|nr:efflux transporter outer membrane subunit [Candidatus Acidoferrum sp.]
MTASNLRRHAVAAAVALIAGCSQAPDYQPPVIATAPAYKEAGTWVPAAPAQAAAGHWWHGFNDPQLEELESRLDAGNPTLAIAIARHDAALATLGEARGQMLPTVDLAGSVIGNRQSDTRPLRGATQPARYEADTLGFVINYDLDLWGRLRDSVASAKARADAAGDDVAVARLTLETDLAQTYLELRGIDQLIDLFETTVTTYAQADRLTHNRFAGGIASGIDVGRSGAQLADAQAQLADLHNARAVAEHAIAALVGALPSAFSLAASAQRPALPAVPLELPSTLLQRRPDVAAAERRMYAANRDIGVDRAAFFPQLTLGGTVGYQSTAVGGLLAAPNLMWAVGPNLTQNLFDGGRRKARDAFAQAGWEAATADYRRTALAAFQQVEDSLSRQHYLGEALDAQQRTVQAAAQASRLSTMRYDKGVANFLDVVVAQTAELAARRRAIQLETQRAQVQIGLIRALGGDWNNSN